MDLFSKFSLQKNPFCEEESSYIAHRTSGLKTEEIPRMYKPVRLVWVSCSMGWIRLRDQRTQTHLEPVSMSKGELSSALKGVRSHP